MPVSTAPFEGVETIHVGQTAAAFSAEIVMILPRSMPM